MDICIRGSLLIKLLLFPRLLLRRLCSPSSCWQAPLLVAALALVLA
jgi:hypothetical protein